MPNTPMQQAAREAATICPRPLWPFDWKVLSESHVSDVTWATSVPVLVFLPRPLCSRLRPDVRDRQTDVRQKTLNASALFLSFFFFLYLNQTTKIHRIKRTHTTQKQKHNKKEKKTWKHTHVQKTLHISSHITTCMTPTQHYYQEGADY